MAYLYFSSLLCPNLIVPRIIYGRVIAIECYAASDMQLNGRPARAAQRASTRSAQQAVTCADKSKREASKQDNNDTH